MGLHREGKGNRKEMRVVEISGNLPDWQITMRVAIVADWLAWTGAGWDWGSSVSCGPSQASSDCLDYASYVYDVFEAMPAQVAPVLARQLASSMQVEVSFAPGYAEAGVPVRSVHPGSADAAGGDRGMALPSPYESVPHLADVVPGPSGLSTP